MAKRLLLDGIRVIDIGGVWTGSFMTMILADLGGEVIKVENINVWQTWTRGLKARPTKEYLIGLVPFHGGFPDHREPGRHPWNRSPFFNCHARNKLSCTIDLRKPKGMEYFRRLVRISDAVVENSPTETMEKLGITYDMLKTVKPDIIYLRSPAFGNTGPYKNYRAVGASLEAFIGHTMLKRYPDMDASMTSTTYASDYMAGAQGAYAIMLALHHRNQTGKGQLIELSQAENAIAILTQVVMDYSMNQRIQEPIGNRDPSAAPCGCYRCKGDDRWVNIRVSSNKEWEGFCRALGNPSWTKEERFCNCLNRWQNQDELDKLVEEWTMKHEQYEVMHILQREGVPAGPVLDCASCYSDPQLNERGFFEEVTQEDCGTHRYPGMMWKMSKTPLSIRRPPIRLGEHNEYVYKELLGVSDEEYAGLEAEGLIGMDFAPEIP